MHVCSYRIYLALGAACLFWRWACAQEQPSVKLVVKSEHVPRWEIPVFTVLGIMLTVMLFSYLYHEKVLKQRLAAAGCQSNV
jgi:hypothetical protein